MRFRFLVVLFTTTTLHAQLTTFSAGSLAKAGEVNGNFSYLASRIDSLVKRLDSLGAVASATSVPKGTIAAFLTGPGTDSYLPGSGQTWLIAAGQEPVNGVKIPDLRGQFLRGLDLNVTGATSARYDTDTDRTPGSKQADAFQGHWHQIFMGGASTKSGTLVSQTIFDRLINDRSLPMSEVAADIITDSKNGAPRIAAETRPKNVAVYWYIKVK